MFGMQSYICLGWLLIARYISSSSAVLISGRFIDSLTHLYPQLARIAHQTNMMFDDRILKSSIVCRPVWI